MFINPKQDAQINALSDEEIVKRILDGEDRFREVVYTRYSNKIFYKCFSITKDREASKDLTHDIFFKIFINLSKYMGKSNFSFWVNSITYNACMDYIDKKKKLLYDEVRDDSIENIPDNAEDLLLKVNSDKQLQKMENAIEKISNEERLIIMMFYNDDMSIKEISKALNIGESAAKMRLKRARMNIEKQINKIG